MNLMQIINDDLLNEQEKRKDRVSSGKWTPSSFGRCYRMQYWKRKGEPQTNPPDTRALRVFKIGYIFEDWVCSYLPEEMEKQVKVETDDIKGYADIVTKDEVIDIKTQHSRGFWYMHKDKYDINKEKYTNILQVMAYAYLLNKRKGRLVYISKDDLCVEEYGFALEKWKPEIEKELVALRRIWEKGTLPKAEPRAYGGKECKWCPYLDNCKKEEGK